MKSLINLVDLAERIVGIVFRNIVQHLLLVLILCTSGPSWAQKSTQTLRGKIVDQDSKQPIVGASIIVVNTNPTKGAATDAEGYFKIEQVEVGRVTLKITYLGYENLTVPDVVVSAGKEVILNLGMTEAVTTMNEAVITYNRKVDRTVTNNEMATVSSRSFNPDDTKKFAGALGDPSRMAANFAGVVAGNDSRNDIVVRGNSPNAMLWQMEGVNIPNPNHFGNSYNTGGPVSILNANNIGKSDFFTSAFPAQYGNANGGVFDLVLREGNYEKHEFIGQIGFNGFEVGAEGPLSKKSKATYIFNYRYSTLAVMKNFGINPGTGAATPLYQDMNFKIAIPTKGKGKISLWGMGGVSAIDLLGEEVDTTEIDFYGSRDENTIPRFRSGVVALSYEKNIGAKTWAKTTLAASQSYNYYTSDRIDRTADQTYRIGQGNFKDNKYSFVLNLTHKFNAKNVLHAGFTNDYTQFDYFNKNVYNKGTIDTIMVDQKGAINLTQGYVQWKHRFGPRFTTNIGLHSQYFNVNKQLAIEPRIGLRYMVSDKASINMGYGLHHQTLPTYNLFLRNAMGQETNKDLDFIRSNHGVIGYENNINKLWKFKIEAYYQYIDQVPVNAYLSSFSSLNTGAAFVPNDEVDLVNDGTGENYGIELTIERYFDKGFYILATGSVFDSKYKGSDGIERNTAFNTKYAANLLAGKEFNLGKKGNVLYANIRLTTTGGKYFTPLDFVASQARGQATYDNTRAFSEQQSAYFRADVKIGFRKEYKKSSMEFGVDFQNVTSHQNVFSQGYNKYNNTISYQYQQGFFPVPMFRFTF